MMFATLYPIKHKLDATFFIALLNTAINTAGTIELIGTRAGDVLGNAGTENKNLIASVSIKLPNLIIAGFLKEGNNFRNVVSKVTQVAGHSGILLALAGEMVRPQGDGNATGGREERAKKGKNDFIDWPVHFCFLPLNWSFFGFFGDNNMCYV